MSQVDGAGFPWNSLPTEKSSSGLSEKISAPERTQSDATDPSTDITTKVAPTRCGSEKTKHSTKSKKRSSSVQASGSQRSVNKSLTDYKVAPGSSKHYNVRTIPPWVRDADEDDIDFLNDGQGIDSPHAALVAHHNHAPSDPSQYRGIYRDGYPTSSGAIRPERTSRWITFARASAYPREAFHGEEVDADWLNENFTDYSKPWLADQDEHDPEKGSGIYRAFRRKRQAWYKRIQVLILRHPFVPLAFRATILLFAAIAIGLGASIYKEANIILDCTLQSLDSRTSQCISLLGTEEVDYYRDPSALMAVIVDVISIVYTLYITYDEYFSKPLGLRPARAKVRLVLLDLFFIVFQAANLSLAFESLTVDEGACAVGDEPSTSVRFDRICDRAEALSAVLIVSLVAWLLTFSVSVLRLVERINIR